MTYAEYIASRPARQQAEDYLSVRLATTVGIYPTDNGWVCDADGFSSGFGRNPMDAVRAMLKRNALDEGEF